MEAAFKSQNGQKVQSKDKDEASASKTSSRGHNSSRLAMRKYESQMNTSKTPRSSLIHNVHSSGR